MELLDDGSGIWGGANVAEAVPEADGSGVGVGVGPPVPAALVVGAGLVAGVVDAARVAVGVGVGLPVSAGLVVGDVWMALAPVAAGCGIQRRLLATAGCEATSSTSASKR